MTQWIYLYVYFKTVVRLVNMSVAFIRTLSILHFAFPATFRPFGLSRRTQVPAALLVAEFYVSLTLNPDLC